MKKEKIYSFTLNLDENQIQKRLDELNPEEYRKLTRLIKIARATDQWGKNLIAKLQTHFPNFAVYTRTTKYQDNKSKKQLLAQRYRESFATYLLRIMADLASEGVVYLPLADKQTFYDAQSFEQLGYNRDADDATWSTESCYKFEGAWLVSQATVAMNYAARGKKLSKPTYTICRVNRRENPDSLHSLQFTQLEFRQISRNGLPDLKKRIAQVLRITGLDLHKIHWRPTHNTYTAPSIEIYYPGSKGLTQILNGGVFLRRASEQMGTALESDEVQIGFAVGLERCYMLKHGLPNLSAS